MWLRHIQLFVVLAFVVICGECEGISNANFNAQIRGYSEHDNTNLTDVKTLQKQSLGLGKYSIYNVPAQNPVKFKEVPDSMLSGSSQSRGLLHHEHTGYVLSDYDDPHYGGHGFEYQPHEPEHHFGFPDPGPGLHHVPHHHVGGYGHHHKHYDHALAAKSLLWPIAGIALLGAAAALVSNPVLLQLGVVSGRRKRRQTEETEFAKNSIKKWSQIAENSNKDIEPVPQFIKRRTLRKSDLKTKIYHDNKGLVRKTDFETTKHTNKQSSEDIRDKLISIPLKFKDT